MTNPNESNEVMRADFESWINATYGHDCIRRDEAGDYEDIATCSQWDAWQAASIATPQPQTVRYALERAANIVKDWGGEDWKRPHGEIRALIEPLSADKHKDDTKLLDAIQNGSWDVRSINLPTLGGDDAEVGWRVIEHYMDKPHERIIGENFNDDVRSAIRAAIKGNSHE